MAMNCKCESKMVFSCYQKQRIYGEGYKAPTIAKLLHEEGLQCSQVKIIKKFQDTDNINRRVASGQPCMVTSEVKQVVEEQMQQDNKTTPVQLYHILTDKGCHISLQPILRCRMSLV